MSFEIKFFSYLGKKKQYFLLSIHLNTHEISLICVLIYPSNLENIIRGLSRCVWLSHKAISNITSNTPGTKRSNTAAAQHSSWHRPLVSAQLKQSIMLPLMKNLVWPNTCQKLPVWSLTPAIILKFSSFFLWKNWHSEKSECVCPMPLQQGWYRMQTRSGSRKPMFFPPFHSRSPFTRLQNTLFYFQNPPFILTK